MRLSSRQVPNLFLTCGQGREPCKPCAAMVFLTFLTFPTYFIARMRPRVYLHVHVYVYQVRKVRKVRKGQA